MKLAYWFLLLAAFGAVFIAGAIFWGYAQPQPPKDYYCHDCPITPEMREVAIREAAMLYVHYDTKHEYCFETVAVNRRTNETTVLYLHGDGCA